VKRTKRLKVMVIGLDGATFDLLDPWMEAGRLPNFARLAAEGVKAPLTSVVQPTSPGAWTTFATGKNPGKHGLFDWRRRRPGSYELIPVSGYDRHGQTLWDLLSEANRKVGVINVPMTYPPEMVNGFMISGLDTPGADHVFTYPPSLYREIVEACGAYIIDTTFDLVAQGRCEEWLAALQAMVEGRWAATRYLMEKLRGRWDFLMAVFVFPDRLQHVLWHCLDPSHPHHNPEEAEKYGPAVLDFFRWMDGILGDIMGRLDDAASLFVVSDHGFGPIHKALYLNKWLASQGLLHFKDEGGRLSVDWPNTLAYAYGYHGNIYVNLRGREPEGIVNPGSEYERLRDRIIAMLEAMVDPEDNQPIVEKVFKREEIYRGEHVAEAPDILFQTREMLYRVVDGFDYSYDPSAPVIAPLPPYQEGSHRMDGILLAWGAHITQRANCTEASLADLAPTILHLMGLPVPEDMDGRVLEEILEPAFMAAHPARFIRASDTWGAPPRDDGYSEEDIDIITERLRRLGYLG